MVGRGGDDPRHFAIGAGRLLEPFTELFEGRHGVALRGLGTQKLVAERAGVLLCLLDLLAELLALAVDLGEQ
jgi:hypothetical protein